MTPSAVGERQMLPKHTKQIRTMPTMIPWSLRERYCVRL
jgi:hypothetical protein